MSCAGGPFSPPQGGSHHIHGGVKAGLGCRCLISRCGTALPRYLLEGSCHAKCVMPSSPAPFFQR